MLEHARHQKGAGARVVVDVFGQQPRVRQRERDFREQDRCLVAGKARQQLLVRRQVRDGCEAPVAIGQETVVRQLEVCEPVESGEGPVGLSGSHVGTGERLESGGRAVQQMQ